MISTNSVLMLSLRLWQCFLVMNCEVDPLFVGDFLRFDL
jgi:hypothetical protein